MDIALFVVNLLLLCVLIWHGREFVRHTKALHATQIEAHATQLEAQKSRLADHERRKKQSTVEYFTANRLATQETRQRLDYERRSPITDDEARKLLSDEATGDQAAADRASEIKIFLATYEYLAVGVNTGIFDIDVVARMSGSLVRHTYRTFEPYIKMARTQRNQPALFEELEVLAEALEERLKTKEGALIHS